MDRLQLFFEEVKEGDESPVFVKSAITRTDIDMYAGASRNFSPIHIDDVAAHRLGYERVFAMGMMSVGYLAHLATDWLGDSNLRRFKVRFGAPVWPGDTLSCRGVITKKYEGDGDNLVDCDLYVENQRGDKVITGWATATLPTRVQKKT